MCINNIAIYTNNIKYFKIQYMLWPLIHRFIKFPLSPVPHTTPPQTHTHTNTQSLEKTILKHRLEMQVQVSLNICFRAPDNRIGRYINENQSSLSGWFKPFLFAWTINRHINHCIIKVPVICNWRTEIPINDARHQRISTFGYTFVLGMKTASNCDTNMSVGMWGCPLSQLPPHLQGYEAATTWVAEIGSNHLQTDGLVF